MKTKALADVTAKWGEVTPTKGSYYEKGAVGSGADWEKNAMAAKATYKAAVSASNIDSLFAGGIKQAGAAKFERKVKDVGVSRFSSGVTAALTDYSSGVSPFLDTLSALQLPARAQRGSDSNLARVTAIASALHKKRLALKAAG